MGAASVFMRPAPALFGVAPYAGTWPFVPSALIFLN